MHGRKRPFMDLYDCRIRSRIIVCRRVRLQYTSVFRFALKVSEYITVSIFLFIFFVLDYFDLTVPRTVSVSQFV